MDDVIVYRRSGDFYWMVVNAGNRAKDWDWLASHRLAGARMRDDWPTGP